MTNDRTLDPNVVALRSETPVGRTYRHFKGGRYELLYHGTDEATLEPVVIYRSLETDEIWVRPLAAWCERVGEQRRFTLEWSEGTT